MRPTKYPCALNQLTLFRPLSPAPRWTDFPAEVREQALKLLSRFLRHRRKARILAQEVRDE